MLDNESGSRESEEEEDGGWRWEGPKLGAVVVVRVIRVIIYLFYFAWHNEQTGTKQVKLNDNGQWYISSV